LAELGVHVVIELVQVHCADPQLHCKSHFVIQLLYSIYMYFQMHMHIA
jgi:hypothetical protein